MASAAKYPAFREELVSTLLHSLSMHGAGQLHNTKQLSLTAEDEGAALQDIAGILKGAADMHARSRLCDWMSASKIALQVRA